jgi:prevent-host-death family protein
VRRASISEAKNKLSALIDEVKNGETIVITDRGQPVARLEPVGAAESDEDRLARLERSGIIRRAKDKGAIKEILSTPPIELKSGASVLQALLDERAENER